VGWFRHFYYTTPSGRGQDFGSPVSVWCSPRRAGTYPTRGSGKTLGGGFTESTGAETEKERWADSDGSYGVGNGCWWDDFGGRCWSIENAPTLPQLPGRCKLGAAFLSRGGPRGRWVISPGRPVGEWGRGGGVAVVGSRQG